MNKSDQTTGTARQPLLRLTRIAVIGGGAWGTALAITAARAGREVTLWAREAEVVAAIRAEHRNPVFLPEHAIPESVRAETDLGAAVAGADAIILAVPSQFLRSMADALRAVLAAATPIVICAKGIERGTGLLLAAVVAEALPGHPLAVLSGPTFATEVAAGLPTAITVASQDVGEDAEASLAAAVALALGTPTFRPYVSDDVVGVEVGGAVKNVIAIASGIATGLGFGANTRAALITRGLEEIKCLAEALGGRSETVTGLAGMGDLTLTCSSEQSRNMRYGMGLARGQSTAEIFGGRPVVVEGVENAMSVTDLARRLGLDMPICEAVRAVIEGKPVAEAMTALLARPFRAEPRHIALRLPQKG
jgi:glycerol-3-phosphate dehydrogenase (NAD(P)+)